MTETPEYRYHDSMEEIASLIRGRVPIIWVLTHEETRFIHDFEERIGKALNRKIWLWSSWQGLVPNDQANASLRATGDEKDTHNPQKALSRIVAHNPPTGEDAHSGLIYIMRDFHTVMTEPIPRQIRDMYDHLSNNIKTMIIVSPMLAHGASGQQPGISPTLEKQISVVSYELPTRDMIRSEINTIISAMKESTKSGKPSHLHLEYSEEELESFARALQGLTHTEIINSVASCFTHMNKLDVNKLLSDKRQLIRKSDILEYIDTPVGMEDVGGLDIAKQYLGMYARAHTDEAREYGVEPLKGIILTGVPGSGKSLLAKVTGKLWMLPLLRLDVGKVMGSLVGSSEARMRDVIAMAQAMSPCLLWLDEVEKSLSGTKSSNFSDGGTLARVFGTLLTAMQDGLDGVTIIATANDINALPPEFIRRFNEVFFVDLPAAPERKEIFNIHLAKRGRDPKKFDSHMKDLIAASDGYTGAEIEKAIKDAIAASFYSDKKDTSYTEILEALKNTKPISKVMGDKIKKMREKAKGQYRYASSLSEAETKRAVKTKGGKKLDLSDALDDMTEVIKTPKEKAKEEKDASHGRFKELDLN